MYDGKLINLISKKKGKNVDASNSLCSIRQERVQVAINEGKGPFWLDPACVNESPVEDKVYYNVKNFLSSLQCRLSSPSATGGISALKVFLRSERSNMEIGVLFKGSKECKQRRLEARWWISGRTQLSMHISLVREAFYRFC
ncbi:uncharacterized protein LOC114299321 isoform X3 [Camellia sinensis]|uniref:uncharacterized protein LOC114299321 isoform X3 n=1 Tax=Camellia sinensis TaxID=4442 RepID=UPI001036E91F|nr:uncharacterized protein LOC114299321 isoform X3 [Camellia sinensis]